MVARKFDTDTVRGTVSEVFFELFETGAGSSPPAETPSSACASRLFPPTPADAPARPWLLGRAVVALGAGALVIGIALGIALAPTSTARTLAVWAGVQTLLWAVARWLLMRFATGRPARDGAALLGATSVGLIA